VILFVQHYRPTACVAVARDSEYYCVMYTWLWRRAASSCLLIVLCAFLWHFIVLLSCAISRLCSVVPTAQHIFCRPPPPHTQNTWSCNYV